MLDKKVIECRIKVYKEWALSLDEMLGDNIFPEDVRDKLAQSSDIIYHRLNELYWVIEKK